MAGRRVYKSARVLTWMTGFFLSAQLAGGWVLDNVCPVVRCPVAYNHFAVLDRMLAGGQAPNVIYLGSSRLNSCLHEGVLTTALRELTGKDDLLVLNGAGGGGDLVTADYELDEFLRRGARPSLIVVELLPETVNHVNQFLNMQIIRQFTWKDIPEYFAETCRAGYLAELLQSRLLPLHMHRHRIWKLLAMQCNWPILGIDWGYPHRDWNKAWDVSVTMPDAVAPDDLKASLAALERSRQGVRDFRVGGTSMRALDRLMQRCRQRDIEILFVCPPLTTLHRQHYTPDVEAQFAVLLDELRETPGCRVVDARDRVPDALFVDNHHAGVDGMLHFAPAFCREALAPYWQNIQYVSTIGADMP